MTIYSKKFHQRYSTGLRMCLQLNFVNVGVGGGLQVYGICSRRLVYSKVVEAQSNYRKSYLYWFRNSVFVNSTWSSWIEKDWVVVPPGLVWENSKGGVVWLSVREVSSDDWGNGALLMSFWCMVNMVLVLWGFKDKIMLHCFREVKCHRDYTPEICYKV